MTTDMRHAVVEVLKDSEAVAMEMARLLIRTVKEKQQGRVRIALSGGSTPKQLFAILAQPDMARQVDWSRVEIFYGDERHVPEGHADSNHASARELLLSRVSIPAAQVHPMPTAATVAEDAASYQSVLEQAYGATKLEAGRPLFDIVMLGLGTDGHTASLFPGEPVLEEKKAWVGVAAPRTAPHERLTLTYPAIASSALVVFLVTGENKVPMLARLRQGDGSIPSGRIVSEGKILILADEAAAGELS
ncbi:6-phosphogluconolactonase [Parasaccharibacter sp. TMW2.1882]|uniref:6-phosphogluconolactonase n=1 Tax=Parasaccharibacter apium TaxID=1510841 RepID=A0A7U7J1D5_9PROT|nr:MULTISPECIES: 6-phosphogluconolactonase [Acetobacteraceae]MCL1562170.1 6-phosphogluconolactonase [Parasaccharibacter sp. TMW 2.1886]MUG79048.1 6-phosphogluconolactonase [Bombella sp. ESL0380]MUH02360.1 6-phosphogluconolactonase [Bombella sp. ESL0387]QGT74766.1 6-phosphogluconolactonase [Bombella sp. ESL0368]MCK8636353.1 6-phosphogluconolactonase [Parasaccharibacter sp. TMW2.1885]